MWGNRAPTPFHSAPTPVRQHDMTSLENLMDRIEAGQPYGDQSDIVMLLEEVIKRLEGRMVAKIDDILGQIIQQNESGSRSSSATARSLEPASPTSSSQRIRKISSKPKPPLEPNMDVLTHEAQDIVEDAIMTAMESYMDVTETGQQQEDAASPFRPSRFKLAGNQRQECKVAGRPTSSPKKRFDSKPFYGTRSRTQDTTSSGSEKPRPHSSPQPHPDGENLNPTYTYILRNSMQRSIPKYLRQDSEQSRAAVMHMFTDIRHAMADDSIEGVITDVLEKAFFDGDDDETRGGSFGEQWMTTESRPWSSREEIGQGQTSTQTATRGQPDDTQWRHVQGPVTKYDGKVGSKDTKIRLQDMRNTTDTSDSRKEPIKHVGGDHTSMRYDSNLNYIVKRTLQRAVPKYTYNKLVSGALLRLSDKLMDEVPLQHGSLSLNHDDIVFKSNDKETVQELPKSCEKVRPINKNTVKENLPWIVRGKNEGTTPKKIPYKEVKDIESDEDLPWISRGQDTQNSDHDIYYEALPWVARGKDATSSKVTNYDASDDLPWVRKGIPDTGNAYQNRTTIPVHEIPGPSNPTISTQTSLRALCDYCDFYPQTITAGRSLNKNSNQSGDSISLSSEGSIQEEIFYDALCSPLDLQIIVDYQDDNMSFLKRFRLNLLFRKKKGNEKKFVSAVHKVIEARRSGCIDDDGNFVQSIPVPPSPKNDGSKSPPPTVKPKPKKSLDKNGNKRESKKRGSSKRRHNPDRESYPLPEEDDGSEGYASASEMDNFDFNPTAFLERNRRSAENNRFYKDDGAEADVESDSDGANSSSRRVRFSDDVQHFGDIVALGEAEAEAESSDNLDVEDHEDDETDRSRLSLKSKIELFEKVGSNEFLDERSFQGSPPPDLPEQSTLPTKDRVQLFEDIHCGKKPTTCYSKSKTPRRAVDSCQFTLTQSKISFFEELSGKKKTV